MADNKGLQLTTDELSATFMDPAVAVKFPPILSIDQAAELLQVPKNTIYDWSSRGLLKRCGRKIGKHLRFFRSRLIQHLFNGELNVQE